MIDKLEIKAELETDPQLLGFAAHATDSMEDKKWCADKLNEIGASGESKNRGIIPASEVTAALVPSDVSVLSSTQQNQLNIVISAGQVDINSAEIQLLFDDLFSGLTTHDNLAALRTEPISRADALGWPSVRYWDIGRGRE